ncbi:putative kinase-related protein [Phaeoacremonium minimum UCRPA7]|uniref:Putative kinase-related protein n=1 Tax=Phaeoacremonium minimum (strain UCR-PA7) TaxID=1286976 RepID=R8BVR2_PHAM7|nr:putative kinase-related protein [Phaeoacremonium minimum UCRPA7]EOO03442.1 putative kinase-related protein [Phaeoacremonium minimum UCRPA7]
MDDQITRLVDKVWDKFLRTPPERRLSKTTLSQLLTSKLNARHMTLDPSSPEYTSTAVAAFVPMDGYHLTRDQLSAMPDPITAHARRGAEFTFDGASFLRLVQALREPLAPSSETVYAPSFDHAVKDPKDNDIPIAPSHRIVVFEGNYVVLDQAPWSDAAALMDERWFVEVDFAVARKRLVRRHVAAGISPDEADADKRATENDLVNGAEIVDKRLPLDEIIVSREDEAWVHE